MSLTDEDKQWITEQLRIMATGAQLEQAVERMATRAQLEQAVERMATRAQLEQAVERMATRAQLEQAVERMATCTQLEQAEERMAQRIERVETALLTEFHKWASPLEMRLRSHSAVLRTFDLELEAVNDRIKKLEDQK